MENINDMVIKLENRLVSSILY